MQVASITSLNTEYDTISETVQQDNQTEFSDQEIHKYIETQKEFYDNLINIHGRYRK